MTQQHNQSNRYFSLRGFRIPVDTIEFIVKNFSNREVGIIFTAMIDYHKNKGICPQLQDKSLAFALNLFINQFKKDEQAVNNNLERWWYSLRNENDIPENIKFRRSTANKKWRKSVLKRDKFTCQRCNSIYNLHAHHIKQFAKYPDLRFNINNGITLCAECHREEHKNAR
jgi:hypothetical protein